MRKLVWDFLFFSEYCRIWFVPDEWPSNEAQSLCVDSTWSKMEFQLTSQMCCHICPTPGTCLTTGLVTNLTRNIAKDSFSLNSSQLYISSKILSRWYEFITRDCSVLRQFAVFNPPLITWYQITHPFLPSFLPIPYSFRQILAFRAHQ